jgi:hypothetical protein
MTRRTRDRHLNAINDLMHLLYGHYSRLTEKDYHKVIEKGDKAIRALCKPILEREERHKVRQCANVVRFKREVEELIPPYPDWPNLEHDLPTGDEA